MGVGTVADLVDADPVMIRRRFNVIIMRTALALSRVTRICSEEECTGEKDQLIVSRSFSEKATSVDRIRQALSVYGQQSASRLVRHQHVAKTLTTFAGTSHWVEQMPPPAVHVVFEIFSQPHEDAGITTLIGEVQKKTGPESVGLSWYEARPSMADATRDVHSAGEDALVPDYA